MGRLLGSLHLTGGLVTMFIVCLLSIFLSELSSNTAAAAISIPMVISLTGSLGLNPIPYVLAVTASSSCAYILPVTTRAIPVGFGLDAGAQMKEGLKLSLITLCINAFLCWLSMEYLPMFSHL